MEAIELDPYTTYVCNIWYMDYNRKVMATVVLAPGLMHSSWTIYTSNHISTRTEQADHELRCRKSRAVKVSPSFMRAVKRNMNLSVSEYTTNVINTGREVARWS